MSEPKPDLTIADKTRLFFGEKLTQGFVIEDKATAKQLIKMALDDMKLSQGHYTKTRKILQEVLESKGISIADKGFKKSIEGIKFDLVKEDTKLPIESKPQDTTSQSAIGPSKAPESTTLGPSEILERIRITEARTETTEPKKLLAPEMKDEYEKILGEGFSYIGKTYVKLGIIEAEGVEPEKPKNIKEIEDEFREVGKSWAGYCYRHNIELPKLVELIFIGGYSFFVIAGPILTMFMFGKSKKKAPEDTNLEGVGEDVE